MLRTRVWQELDRLRKSGATLIVTTQYVTESEYCDSVALISEGNLVAYAAPEDLRRQALGGDVIEVGTTTPFDVRSLAPVEGVVSVRQTGPAQLLVVADDAGVATPRVNDAIEAAGGTVDYSREFRPTFDEIFATLVTNHAEQKKAAEAIVADRIAGAEQTAPEQIAPAAASGQAGAQPTRSGRWSGSP